MNVNHVLRVKCGICGLAFDLNQDGIIEREIPGYPFVKDYGVTCPRGHFTHSFFLSQAMADETERIRNLPPGNLQTTARNSYRKRFEQFQADMTAQLSAPKVTLDDTPTE